MYLTIFSTKSESSDHYLYQFQSKKKPTLEQIEWWLKENAHDKDDTICFESVNEFESIKLDEIPLVKLKTKDPLPKMEFF